MDSEKLMMQRRIDNLIEQLELVKRQRDAVVETLHGDCWHCKHEESFKCAGCKYSYDVGGTNDYWEWCGLFAENGGVDDA